jgi:hypothetical protein
MKSLSIEPLSRYEFIFAPNFDTVAKVEPISEPRELLKEKSMYSATMDFALEHGGLITKNIISKIPDWYYNKATKLKLYPNIDIRVHDLNLEKIPPGYDLYPAIPGWHADGEFRETYFAQPDLTKVPVSFHIISTVSTHPNSVSNPQYLLTPIKMSTKEMIPDSSLWQSVHNYVEKIKDKNVVQMKDGNIIIFDARSLHRVMPVTNSGIRLFFRMSMWHKPNLGNGQLSKQEQLYLLPRNGTLINKSVSKICTSSRVIKIVQPTETISSLAEEQSMFGATIDYVLKNGGSVSKRVVSNLPTDLIESKRAKGLEPVMDIMVFRLYPSYRPYFVNHESNPVSVDWHTSSSSHTHDKDELWLSISSHMDGVNQTEFSDHKLVDGQMFLTLSSNPRRELCTKNRGWRYMMRMRFVPNKLITKPVIITQQYVDPSSEDIGW